jgi:hypothetical protein
MRQIAIEDSTFNELAKLTQPLQGDTADTVIARLIKSYKKNGHAPGATAKASGKFITRKVNPDDIKKFLRPKFATVRYWQAARQCFIEKKQERIGVLPLVNMIFDFPNTPEKTDRVNRAVRSMSVALRGYTGGIAAETFKEPETDVFQLRKK